MSAMRARAIGAVAASLSRQGDPLCRSSFADPCWSVGDLEPPLDLYEGPDARRRELHEVADACFAEEARGAGWGEATPVDRRRSGWVTSLNVSELSRELQTKPDAGPRGAPSMGSWTA